MAPRISVVINTLNEERNLPSALRSVQSWADEVVVVDMYSEDRTAEIAREFGARVYMHERTKVVEGARKYAISKATGAWVLLLDADEMVSPPLSRLLRTIAVDDMADVVNLPRLNFLLGAPLGHTGWGPDQDRQLRFFKPEFLRVSDIIHAALTPVERARVLDVPYRDGAAIVHFNYLDLAHFLDKLNRYTTVEAQQAYARGRRADGGRALLHAAHEFFHRYVRKGGFRDGWRGFYLSLFMGFYRLATYAKLKEVESLGSSDAALAVYRAEAQRLLDGYVSPASASIGTSGAVSSDPE